MWVEMHKSQRNKMQLRLFFIGLILFLTSNAHASVWGCKPAKIKPSKTTLGCFTVDEQKRYYHLRIPASYHQSNRLLPLIIGLHGGADKARKFEKYSQLSRLSDNEQMIAVYPVGIDKHWNDGRPQVNPGVDDVKFLQQLIHHLKQQLNLSIDNNKVALVGISNGGLMVMRAVCEQPHLFKLGVVVAASMSTQIAAYCPKRKLPIAMMFVFGDKDTTFLSNGKQVSPVNTAKQLGSHIGINKTINVWIKNNQCQQKPLVKVRDNFSDDGTLVEIKQYQQCQQPVVFYDIKNGGHRWPDMLSGNGAIITKVLNLGLASNEMNTAEEIWMLLSTLD